MAIKKTAAELAKEKAANPTGKRNVNRNIKHYTIQNCLKECREANKLSLGDVQACTGVGAQTVSGAEEGGDIGLSRALMLAAFYEKKVEEIWTGQPVEKEVEESDEDSKEAVESAA